MRVGGPTHPKREDVKFHVLPPCGVELSYELDVLRKFFLQFLSILRVRAEADLYNGYSDFLQFVFCWDSCGFLPWGD